MVGRLGGADSNRRGRKATIIALIGVGLSMVTIILSFAIIQGFKTELRHKILSYSSPISIYDYNSEDFDYARDNTTTVQTIVTEQLPNARISKSMYMPALIKSAENFTDLVLQHDSDSLRKDSFSSQIVEGSMPDDNALTDVAFSSTTAKELGVELGDKVDIVIPEEEGLKIRKGIVKGIFDTHFSDYDAHIAFVSKAFMDSFRDIGARKINKFNIDFPFSAEDNIFPLSNKLQTALNQASAENYDGHSYKVANILEEAGIYFGWLSIMDTNVVIITVLMAFISLFTLISSIIIIILNRIPLIGVLKTLGASNGKIKRIFLLTGLRIVAMAIIIADLISVGIILLQREFLFLRLDPSEYYLDSVPMNFNLINIAIINLAAIAVAMISLLIPLIIINKVTPSRSVKFE